jgi:(E)-4-hydroxy-3-methylbut-2-enyl-diphosphate synthase
MEAIVRRKTRQVKVGDVRIGGGAPVSVQSMTKTLTSDVTGTVREIGRLERAGCEIIRVAVRDGRDAECIRKIARKIRIPLVADIHFDYRLALKAIEGGADKIRINPGNITRREELAAVVKSAKKRKVPIRIGVNSGSVPKSHHVTRSPRHGSTSSPSLEPSRAKSRDQVTTSHAELVDAAMDCIKLFEELDFHDIVVSLKASNVVSTVRAYRELVKLCDYPFHLGVTASGLPQEGTIKSAIGIGALLLDGIGDTIRVSLTGSSEEEVLAGRRILSALELRNFGPEIISCPTCGRCQVDLVRIAQEVENAIRNTQYAIRTTKPVRVAIMGCEVNGPGEAREADIGVAAGKGCGLLFRKGKILRRVPEKDFVKVLLKELNRIS